MLSQVSLFVLYVSRLWMSPEPFFIATKPSNMKNWHGSRTVHDRGNHHSLAVDWKKLRSDWAKGSMIVEGFGSPISPPDLLRLIVDLCKHFLIS